MCAECGEPHHLLLSHQGQVICLTCGLVQCIGSHDGNATYADLQRTAPIPEEAMLRLPDVCTWTALTCGQTRADPRTSTGGYVSQKLCHQLMGFILDSGWVVEELDGGKVKRSRQVQVFRNMSDEWLLSKMQQAYDDLRRTRPVADGKRYNFRQFMIHLVEVIRDTVTNKELARHLIAAIGEFDEQLKTEGKEKASSKQASTELKGVCHQASRPCDLTLAQKVTLQLLKLDDAVDHTRIEGIIKWAKVAPLDSLKRKIEQYPVNKRKSIRVTTPQNVAEWVKVLTGSGDAAVDLKTQVWQQWIQEAVF